MRTCKIRARSESIRAQRPNARAFYRYDMRWVGNLSILRFSGAVLTKLTPPTYGAVMIFRFLVVRIRHWSGKFMYYIDGQNNADLALQIFRMVISLRGS